MTIASVTGLVVLLTLAGCARQPLSGPPALRLGRDQCAECGMIVNEERFACGLLVERGGRREHLVYDDAGCMLDAELDGLSGSRILERFVHDEPSRRWIAGDSATLVMAASIATPMGSGIVAFSSREEGEAYARAHAGTPMDWASAGVARRAWRDARRTKTPEPGA